MTGKFFFQGKTFDSEENFWKYVNEWPYLDCDSETFDRLMNKLKDDLKLNIGVYDIKITNGKMNLLIQEVFLLMLKGLMENTNAFKREN